MSGVKTGKTNIALDGDPKAVAQSLVSLIPLDAVCENKELMDAFLSEMFLALAKASSRRERRKRQAEGIAAAKARGVQFGKKTPPLPENFDMIRQAWRNGEYSLIDAAKLCGMPKSTFYNAVQRAEEKETQNKAPSKTNEGREAKENDRTPHREWTADPIICRQSTNAPLSQAGTG